MAQGRTASTSSARKRAFSLLLSVREVTAASLNCILQWYTFSNGILILPLFSVYPHQLSGHCYVAEVDLLIDSEWATETNYVKNFPMKRRKVVKTGLVTLAKISRLEDTCKVCDGGT